MSGRSPKVEVVRVKRLPGEDEDGEEFLMLPPPTFEDEPDNRQKVLDVLSPHHKKLNRLTEEKS